MELSELESLLKLLRLNGVTKYSDGSLELELDSLTPVEIPAPEDTLSAAKARSFEELTPEELLFWSAESPGQKVGE